MASTLVILTVLQLTTLVCCITTADVKSTDNAGEVKNIDVHSTSDDLETDETGWVFNPIQENMRKLEYLKTKLLSPFMTLQSPSYSYGGVYPVYSTGGSSNHYPSYSYRTGYPNYISSGVSSYYPSYTYSGPSYSTASPNKFQLNSYPAYNLFKKPVPYYTPKTWYNKGYTTSTNYAPNCYYPTTFKPSYYKPSTSLSGSPINYYYNNVYTYGTPGLGISSKSNLGYSSGHVTNPVSSSIQSLSPQEISSTAFLIKSSSPQFLFDSSQGSGPSAWIPSVPYAPPSSSLPGVPDSLPSYPKPPAIPDTPSPPAIPALPDIPYIPSTSGLSTFTDPSPSLPTTPAPYYPSLPATSQIPSTPSPPNWESLTGSIPLNPSSVPAGQQYTVSSSSPLRTTLTDQNSGSPGTVVITPPPTNTKGAFVSNLPGPNIVIPDSALYTSGAPYAASYYPNVFFISNEQNLGKSSSVGTAEAVSSQTPPFDQSSDQSSETSLPSSGTSDANTKTLLKAQGPPQPVLTTFYSSNTIDQTRIPIVYPSGHQANVFYSPSVVPSSYSIPISYSYGIPPFGISQRSQPIPAVKSAITLPAYPVPQSIQTAAKVSTPC